MTISPPATSSFAGSSSKFRADPAHIHVECAYPFGTPYRCNPHTRFLIPREAK